MKMMSNPSEYDPYDDMEEGDDIMPIDLEDDSFEI